MIYKYLPASIKPYDGLYFSSSLEVNESNKISSPLVMMDNDIEKYVNYINANRIQKLMIDCSLASFNGYEINNLNFLFDTPSIKFLSIVGEIDISILYNSISLKELIVSSRNQKIHVNRVKGLESFSTGSPENIVGLSSALSLKSLYLDGSTSNKVKLKKAFNDLKQLVGAKNLDTLSLSFMNMEYLTGIENLEKLTVLSLLHCKSLKNIDPLFERKSSIKDLRIEFCYKISDYRVLNELFNLQFLSLFNQKKIGYLNLKKLKSLSGLRIANSELLDGNLTGIYELDWTALVPLRRSYYVNVDGERKKMSEDQLPYNKFTKGDDDIDDWRKLRI